MSKECRNCGSKNTDIEGVFKNCYSCGLRAPVSWEDNDKPASDERVKSTSVKQQLQNDVDVYGIAYERQHPNGLTERIDPTTIRVIKPVPSSERSHSPTEQPGNAKHTPGPDLMQGWEIGSTVYKTRVYKRTGEHEQTLIASCFNEKIAELIARAPALLSEVSTLRSKQAELVAEIKELERHKKELALCLEQANQLIRRYEGIEREQSAELEQLRSERDKMREALKGMEYERARVRPATHDTIVLEWDDKGNVTYCRTFDFPNDEVNARAAIASVGLNNRRYILGKIDGILHLSKFKEDE